MASPQGKLVEDLLFPPEMVGRERELEKLTKHLDDAREGRGSTIFISGEAGIGKTRLVRELEKVARSKGFLVLSAYSLYESLTPYMPFFEALKSGGLESLFAKEAPRVEGVYLVTDTGLLVKEVVREETKLEPNIFASMLSTVDDFIGKSISLLKDGENEGILRRLSHGDFTILVESGDTADLVVVLTGRENEFLINDMRETLAKVHKFCGDALDDWDGNEDSVHGVDRLLGPLITSGKYDGVYYGKEDPRARRNLLFENVSLGLTRQAQMNPVLLYIEDLQWSDPSTLALMNYVARNTTECGLLIIGTYRPEDLMAEDGKAHHLVEAMQRMDREDLYESLEIGRLSEEGVAILLDSVLCVKKREEELVRQVYQGTEGNPLFVLELVKLIIEDGTIKKDNGTWRVLKDISHADIPPKVYDVVVRRLNRLEDDQREVIDAASVRGEEFTAELLASVLRIERMQLLRVLGILEQKHRLIHSREGRYCFDHVKVKEVSYEEIPPRLVEEYHGMIADTIEAHSRDNPDKVAGDLAFHYLRSGDRKKALPHLIRAAEMAKEQFSNEEAIRFYTEALELEEDAQRRMEILHSLGEIHRLMADFEKSIESFRAAYELADEKRKRAEIKATIGYLLVNIGQYDEAQRISTEALGLVESEDCEEKALALTDFGLLCFFRGEYNMALEHYNKSLEIRERIGNRKGIAGLLNNIGLVHREKGDGDQALECFTRSVEISKEIGHQVFLANHFNNIGIVHMDRGDYEKALEYYGRSLVIKERIGDQLGIPHTLGNIAVVHMERGDYEKALEYNRRCLSMSGRIGDQLGVANDLLNIGTVHRERGDYEEALEDLKKSIEVAEKIGSQSVLSEAYCEVAEVFLGKADLEKAREYCNQALSLATEMNRKKDVGSAKLILGKVNRECKMWTEAAENFRESIKIYEETGERIETARSNYEFGLMWKAKGDIDEATGHLLMAVEIFKELSAERDLEKAEVALEDVRGLDS